MAPQRPAHVADRGGTRNPQSRPRRPFDYAAIAAAFAAEGYHQASMDSIANRAGIAKPTLYRYFSSKEELFEAAVAALCDELLEHLFTAYEDSAELTLQERLRVGIRAYFVFADENAEAFQLLFKTNIDRTSAVAKRIEKTFDSITERVTAMYEPELRARGLPAGQVAEMLAAALVGTADFVVRRATERPSWDEEALLDLLSELWMRALAGVDRATLEAADRPARRKRVRQRTKPAS